MVTKSHGKHRRTRKKLKKSRRMTVNQFLKKFKEGDKVTIKIESRSMKSMPSRRFHGLTGSIVGKRGRSYIIEIKDGKKMKKIIAPPEHLKAI